MIELASEFYKFMFPLLLLVFLPVFAAVICFVIDTYIDFRYYQWNKEHHDMKNSPVEE